MKLLLTSAGLSNQAIASALTELTRLDPSATRIAHIPTATMIDPGDKYWMIDELHQLKSSGYSVDLIDVAAVPRTNWEPRLRDAHVIFVSGGNAYWLNDKLQSSGLAELLPELLESRVYVGASAGSSVASKNFGTAVAELFGESDEAAIANPTMNGLELVDFLIKAHLNNPHFPERTESWYQEIAAQIDFPLYALDDQGAVMIDGARQEIVGGGKWLSYNS